MSTVSKDNDKPIGRIEFLFYDDGDDSKFAPYALTRSGDTSNEDLKIKYYRGVRNWLNRVIDEEENASKIA
jgi:hypothetical protein